MYSPRFELAGFSRLPHAAKLRVLEALVTALAIACEEEMRANPGRFPRLLSGSIVYKREPPDSDNWQDGARTLELRSGDCEDLVAWRIAELHVSGEDPAAAPHLSDILEDGITIFHVRVRRGDGRIEDPSRVLGMR